MNDADKKFEDALNFWAGSLIALGAITLTILLDPGWPGVIGAAAVFLYASWWLRREFYR